MTPQEHLRQEIEDLTNEIKRLSALNMLCNWSKLQIERVISISKPRNCELTLQFRCTQCTLAREFSLIGLPNMAKIHTLLHKAYLDDLAKKIKALSHRRNHLKERLNTLLR